MNKIYRVIWSKTKNCYVVASELAKRHTKAPQSEVVNKMAALALVGALSLGFAGSAFAAQLDDSFRQNGILDGFRFISDKEGKLLFGVCVSFPESDMSSPFVLTIGPDGSFIIEPDTTPDIEETDSASV